MSIRKAGSLNRVKNHIKAEECESEFPAFNDEEELRFSKTQIQSAVNNLNQEQGTCIRLMYIEDKSYREISDITGYGLNEVKSHIQNGKRNLKNYLLRQNGTTEI
jgi:RNA polymerase sigma-70 factor (ECF subfamily)